MALLWMDSFDHYVTADLPVKYTTSGILITAGAGRRGSGACEASPTANWARKALTPSGTTCIIGVALKLASTVGFNLLAVDKGGWVQCSVNVDASGFLQVRRANWTGPLLGTATTGALSTSAFRYVEMKVVVDPSAGSVVLRVDGVVVLSLSGINTADDAIGGWNGFQVGGQGFADDLYVLDGAGAAPWNDVLGDCRVDARYPTAEGASSAWTPLSGTDNALMVDETAPDGDTTYTATPTVGATDTFVVQDAPVVGATLYGVQLCLSAKKTDSGTCALAPVVRHAGVDYPGTAFNPGTSYAYSVTPYSTNPGTSAAWTESGFNAAEFGYTRTA